MISEDYIRELLGLALEDKLFTELIKHMELQAKARNPHMFTVFFNPNWKRGTKVMCRQSSNVVPSIDYISINKPYSSVYIDDDYFTDDEYCEEVDIFNNPDKYLGVSATRHLALVV